jgi:hypothetical protein
VDWSGRPCLRDRSGGWLAGFLMLGKLINSMLLYCMLMEFNFSINMQWK